MKYSTYVDGERTAHVVRDGDGNWGIAMYENNEHVRTEIFKGHNEIYAENAAENYVMKIKN